MKKNRFITVLFCLVIATLCGLMLSACAGNEGGGGGGIQPPKDYPLTATDGTLNYSLLEDKSGYTVTGLEDEEFDGDVVIPSTINDLGITKIEARAFSQTEIKTVMIGDHVTTIGGNAFYNAASLTSVSFPASLTTFESLEDEFNTFRFCTSLTDITFAPMCKLTEIPDNAFQGTKLSRVTIPAAVERIGHSAFDEVNSLDALVVGFEGTSKLKTIGDGAFSNSGLTSFAMPNTVSEMGENVFNSCGNLSSVRLSSSLKALKASTFQYATSLQSLEIPAGIEKIERFAFQESGLTTITFALNSNCTEILHNAFIGTQISEIKFPTKLKSIGADTPTDANSGAFAHLRTLRKIIFTSPLVQVAEATFLGCSELADILFEGAGSLESIGDRAFNGCLKINKHIEFPSGLKTVGTIAFNNEFLTVILPGTVEKLGEESFIGKGGNKPTDSITFLHDNIDSLQIGSLKQIYKIYVKSELLEPFKDKFSRFVGFMSVYPLK